MRAAFVAEVRTWLDTPYQHQGRLKGVGVDCIGLVVGALHACGLFVDVDPTGYDKRPDGTLRARMLDYLTPVALDEAQPGDILLFHFAAVPMHIGVLTGPDMITHAYSRNRRVVEHRLDERWRALVASSFSVPGVE
ncbi:peptidase P60 [Paraburkholderia steynii]|uniref:Peptidase P60 n=1 Tax=Paraburkholderia steynii TaxID=1245441 RepID=A0A4R0XD95_9BURK|nr:peptidase P60 [Paraburkholderia steynii]